MNEAILRPFTALELELFKKKSKSKCTPGNRGIKSPHLSKIVPFFAPSVFSHKSGLAQT